MTLTGTGWMMTQNADKLVCLGVITSAHGVKGEVKIKPFTETMDGPVLYGALQDEAATRRFEITASRISGNVLVARFKGITNRDAAEALKGVKLFARRDRLPEPEEETWYYADLVGLSVFDTDHKLIGRISAIHNFGAGDVLEIVPIETGSSDLIPFSQDTVPEIDVAGGQVTIVAPDDLFKPADRKTRS